MLLFLFVQDDESSSDDDGGYLHPSLFASTHIKAKPAHEEKTKVIYLIIHLRTF